MKKRICTGCGSPVKLVLVKNIDNDKIYSIHKCENCGLEKTIEEENIIYFKNLNDTL